MMIPRKGSKMAPRYLILGDSNFLIPFIFGTIRWFNCFLGGMKIMNYVLVTLIDSRFAPFRYRFQFLI